MPNQPKPEYDPAADPFLGIILDGRFRLLSRSGEDNFGVLYLGTDEQTGGKIGVRVTVDEETHHLLHEWLKRAVFSWAKETILTVGHIDQKHSYVVLHEAALDYLKQLPEEPPESSRT